MNRTGPTQDTNHNLKVSHEDPFKYLIWWMKNPKKSSYSTYGYEFYLPIIMRDYVINEGKIQENLAEQNMVSVSTSFYSAAWDLCRRGILRPGLKNYDAQSTVDGHTHGYTLTPFGKQWLSEADKDIFVPTEPERFGQLLAPYRKTFGDASYQKAQEAVRCYGAHAYLACCAMVGASVESALLSLAIEKFKDEEKVVKDYMTAGGRVRLEKAILGQSNDSIKREFPAYTQLLKYWRDAATHGRPTNIEDAEAFTSLATLLRFSAFLSNNWKELASQK